MSAVLQQQCSQAPHNDKFWTTYIEDDFYNYTTAGLWTTLTGGTSGTCAFDSSVFGDAVVITAQNSANDYAGIYSTNTNWTFVANQNIHAMTRVNYTNVSAGNAWLGFGMSSSTALPPSGGGDPTVSYSGAFLYKINSSTDTTWHFQVSNAAVKQTSTSTTSAADGTYVLEWDAFNLDNLSVVVVPKVNGQLLRDSNNNVIKGSVLYASLAAMKLGVVVEAGGSSNQTAYVDLLLAEAHRM